jgi:zinc D-Ala-D-Ala dipeptidase
MGANAGLACAKKPGHSGARNLAMRLTPALAFLILALPATARDLPAGFVYLRDVAPSIAQDMRYASADNFTAAPLPGYDAAECVLRRDAAQALAKVQADLAKDNLSLKTYDCYRPERAVRAMWRWAHDGSQQGDRSHYPAAAKSELFNLGYIASRSKHSTGTAVDLTLIPLGAPAPGGNARRGPCTAPASERAPDNSLDMGTGFDCFDPKTWTRSGAVTPAQRRDREHLRAAMTAHGFRNYFREWWHYEYGSPQRAYDFPIEAR